MAAIPAQTPPATAVATCCARLSMSPATNRPGTPVRLHLLELPQARRAAEGTALELQDGAFPLLDGVEVFEDADAAFDGASVGLLIGARPRSQGMERADLLEANAGIFSV